jgi:hypothetical protein
MELVQETVMLPKEAKEVKDAIVEIVVALKSGKPVVQVVLEELPKLQLAVDGYNKIPEEMKSKEAYVLGGMLGGQLLAAIKG